MKKPKANRYPTVLPILKRFDPLAVAEFKFHKERRWRFDFALPAHLVAIEIDGGCWISGRHNRGSGFIKDIEKFNMATMCGWRVLHFTPQQLKGSEWVETIDRTVNAF